MRRRIIRFSPALNEIVFLHIASQTLILTDTAYHFDATYSWPIQLAAQVIGIQNKLQPSRLEKIAIQDRQAVQQSIEQILNWDFDRVVMAHGTIVEQEAKAQLKAGYEWFLDQH
jgi:hypothetical protein